MFNLTGNSMKIFQGMVDASCGDGGLESVRESLAYRGVNDILNETSWDDFVIDDKLTRDEG